MLYNDNSRGNHHLTAPSKYCILIRAQLTTPNDYQGIYSITKRGKDSASIKYLSPVVRGAGQKPPGNSVVISGLTTMGIPLSLVMWRGRQRGFVSFVLLYTGALPTVILN